ncbi:E3 ubiquitin-protein ligase TRIM39-like [Triplophysa rosa]|uniref:E3 ubiquitin-protein ligase TRIM39-like n=1 Tax=Triplophysa rosa TaxID=992332 RepID=A0A9W7TQL6_TRIRA|nr:E3 ubiquitin-protein ligase TRIM39-like [Triplophysa rosa]KAI7800377.1 putative E3 ubiquitin-protein ligase TRIM39-like [Triplophysa rosa]
MAESSPKSPQARRNSLDRPPISLTSSSSSLSEELQCSICLDVFTDPVTTPCGHNFCKCCLKLCWDMSQDYLCPLCKETFNKRPDFKINTAFTQIVQLFKEMSAQTKSEVLCDMCEDKKIKALKSCLVCQISYCETHLEPHKRIPNLKKHKLIDPVKKPEDYICQKHEKPLEMFCRDDQTYVCLLCAVTDHKTHNTVALEEESEERKPHLMKMQTDVRQMIQDRIKRIQDIKHLAEMGNKSSGKEKADSVQLFTALIRFVERCQAELIEMMEQKQKAAEKHEEDLIEGLEQEIIELKWRDSELENLLRTTDHLHLLQIYPSLCGPIYTNNWPEISVPDTKLSVEPLVRALTKLQKTLDEKLTETVLKTVKHYAVDVNLDPDTAFPNLILSDDGKEVRWGNIKQNLPDNPERFDYCSCVLAKEGFSSGRFYFEVQVKEKNNWDLGVVRESICRKGAVILAPQNGYWTVVLRNGKQYKAYESPSLSLSLRVKPQVVGVFVDYKEGLVSFYDVESRSHIYSFTGQCFTEKLYPYFSPDNDRVGENAAPLIISQSKVVK